MRTPTPKPDVTDARANYLAELTWGKYWISNLEGSQMPTASQDDLLGDLYQASNKLNTRILNTVTEIRQKPDILQLTHQMKYYPDAKVRQNT